MALAYSFVALGLVWLAPLVWSLDRLRTWLRRRPVRRAVNALTGTALASFAVTLAT